MKCGIAALSLFSKIKMIEYLTSIFVIRFFKVSFLIRLDARGQRRRSYETTCLKIHGDFEFDHIITYSMVKK